ncbi:MAG: tRNA threonylcarbamoyladenosine dehydratase [Verrucomicrobiota bacterium]
MTHGFHDRFSGIARLYGDSGLERFRQASVMVVGIGGVGSWTAESLARSGIGHLILVDPDDLCITNTNRQIHAMDDQVGRPKTSAMAERLRAIHPEIRITEHQAFLTEKNAMELVQSEVDAVVDAIDAVRAKCELIVASRKTGTPLVVSGAAGGRLDPTRIRVADLAHTSKDTLLASVRKRLRNEHGFAKAPERGTVPPFGIEAVYSEESPTYPTCDGGTSNQRPEDLPGGIKCDAGYGSITHVTATFGLVAAGRILNALV